MRLFELMAERVRLGCPRAELRARFLLPLKRFLLPLERFLPPLERFLLALKRSAAAPCAAYSCRPRPWA